MSGDLTAGPPVIPGQIRVRGVSRSFKVLHDKSLTFKETVLRRRRVIASEFKALEDVDLDVSPGEAVGIIGRNGSGKSTLLKILAGILSPHAGTVELGGTVTSMLELGSGFHPDFTGRENVLMNGAIHGLTEQEIEARLDEIVEFSELEEFIDNPVRTYSSGMQMRLGYAVAAHLRPDVLLLDEVLSVGDEAFQRKCIAHIFEYRRHGGTLVFVSHDPGQVERVCNRAVLMHQGKIVDEGPPGEVLADYRKLLVSTGAGASSGDVHEYEGEALAEPVQVQAADLVLSGYRLLGPGGVTDRIMSGDPIAIEIDVVAEGGLGTVRATVDVVSDEGPILHESRSRFSVQDGAMTTIRLDLPDLGLNTGGFSVSFRLMKEDTTPLENREHVLPFNVFPRESSRSMLSSEGLWSATITPGAPARSASAERAEPARALVDGFRTGGRDGQVLLIAGVDHRRTHGGGLAVYDGRHLEIIDRVSTVGLALSHDGTLRRVLVPEPARARGLIELLTVAATGLVNYRRVADIGPVTGVASDGDELIVAGPSGLVWLGPNGAPGRREPGGLIPSGMAISAVGYGPHGPVVVATEHANSWLLDVTSGERLAKPDVDATQIVADTQGWLASIRQGDALVAGLSDGSIPRTAELDEPGALALLEGLVAVGQQPADPAARRAASLLLLDPEALQPVASVQLPFASVSAIVASPTELVDGLRAAAVDIHGILSAGAGRREGWLEEATIDPAIVGKKTPTPAPQLA